MLFQNNTTKTPNTERQTASKPVQQNSKTAVPQGFYTGINKPLTPTNTNAVKPPTTTKTSAIQTKQAPAGRPGNYQQPATKSQPVTGKPGQTQKNILGLSTIKQQQRPINTNAAKPATFTKTFATQPKQAQAGERTNYQQPRTKSQAATSNKPGQSQKNFLGLSTTRQQQRPTSTNVVKPKTTYSTSSTKTNLAVAGRGRNYPQPLTKSQPATINKPRQPRKNTSGLSAMDQQQKRQINLNSMPAISTSYTRPGRTQGTSLMQKPLHGWSKFRKSNGKSINTSTTGFASSGRVFTNKGIGKSGSGLKRGWGKYYRSTISPSQNAHVADTPAQFFSNNISAVQTPKRGWSYYRATSTPPNSASLSFANNQDTPAISVEDACKICGCTNNGLYH